MHPAILLLIVLLLIVLACLIAVKFFGAKFGGMFDPSIPVEDQTYGMLHQNFNISHICTNAIRSGQLLDDNPFYYMYVNCYKNIERSDFNDKYYENINKVFEGYEIVENSGDDDITKISRIGFVQLLLHYKKYDRSKFLEYISAVETCLLYIKSLPPISTDNSVMKTLTVDDGTSMISVYYDTLIIGRLAENINISVEDLQRIVKYLKLYIEMTDVNETSSGSSFAEVTETYINIKSFS